MHGVYSFRPDPCVILFFSALLSFSLLRILSITLVSKAGNE